MKTTLAVLVGAAGLIAATSFTTVSPASAQGVRIDAGPVGVRVGEPGYRHRYRHRCRVVRERIVRPSGRVVYREREVCR
ncbi:MAG: hypothetical protein AB7K04_02035 [Pseudorhodoplanes sp.]